MQHEMQHEIALNNPVVVWQYNVYGGDHFESRRRSLHHNQQRQGGAGPGDPDTGQSGDSQAFHRWGHPGPSRQIVRHGRGCHRPPPAPESAAIPVPIRFLSA